MERSRAGRMVVLAVIVLGVVALYAFGVFGGGGAMAPAEAASAERLTAAKAEIRQVFVEYAEGVSAKDLDACMEAFSKDPDTVMLGTGPGERWVGPEEIADAHQHFLASFDSETSKRTWSLGTMQGDVAWFAAMFEVAQYTKNVKNEFFLNMSGVMVKQDGEWKIAQIHLSNLTGSDMPPQQ